MIDCVLVLLQREGAHLLAFDVLDTVLTNMDDDHPSLSSSSIVAVAHRDANDAMEPAGRRERSGGGKRPISGRPELSRGRYRSWRGARWSGDRCHRRAR
jgi:hypothetical protein